MARFQGIDFSSEAKKRISTRYGSTALVDIGEGFPTVFVHGVGQSAAFWRHQIAAFKDQRRCIAVDLMAHGHTEAVAGQDVSFRQQASMIDEMLTVLDIGSVDLVLNDSGGAIGQIMAVNAPDRVRSMVITNCDVHDNWPPATLGEIRTAAIDGRLADQFGQLALDPDRFRAADGIGPLVYEDPSIMTDELLRHNLLPLVSSEERKAAFNRYVGFQDHRQLVAIEDQLRKLETPSLIVWGTGDVFFPTRWAYWLKAALSHAEEVIELAGAKLFFPEERPAALNAAMRTFWQRLAL